MPISPVAYTATLLKYIADRTGLPTGEAAEIIGKDGISRLIHNAPMNQLLPIDQIAAELIHYYGLPGGVRHPAEPDNAFGQKAAEQVFEKATSKYEYGAGLLAVLGD